MNNKQVEKFSDNYGKVPFEEFMVNLEHLAFRPKVKKACLIIDGGHFMKAIERYGNVPMQNFIKMVGALYDGVVVDTTWCQGLENGEPTNFHRAISYPRNGGVKCIIRPPKLQNVKTTCGKRMQARMEAGVDCDLVFEITKAMMNPKFDFVIALTGDGDLSRPFLNAPQGAEVYVLGLEGTINETLNPFVKPVITSTGKIKDYLYLDYIFEAMGCEPIDETTKTGSEKTESGSDDDEDEAELIVRFAKRW